MTRYLDNLYNTLVTSNEAAYREGKGKAWDNVKRKNRVRYCPRGKAFKELEKRERLASWRVVRVFN